MKKCSSVLPLHTLIVEILHERDELSDTELYKTLQKTYGELSLRELNKSLMCLELEGIIHVFKLTKSKRHIELRKNK